MRMPLMTCKQWDVAVVPFPFVETSKAKPRPVLIVSSNDFISENDHCVAAMITSATHTRWYRDTSIVNLSKAGLKKDSIVRLKLFTLDMRFKPRLIGNLSKEDRAAFLENFRASFFSLKR